MPTDPTHDDLADAVGAVRRELELDGPVDRVWERLASAEGLGGWLADEVLVDVRPGAEGVVRDGDGPARPVRVEEVLPGRRLALRWTDEGGESLVELTLTPVPVPAEDDDASPRTRLVAIEIPLGALRRATATLAGPRAAALAGA